MFFVEWNWGLGGDGGGQETRFWYESAFDFGAWTVQECFGIQKGTSRVLVVQIMPLQWFLFFLDIHKYYMPVGYSVAHPLGRRAIIAK